MKTTIDIPERELEEAMRHTGATTKKEAVLTALVDFNRRRRLAKLVEKFGTFEHFLTHEDLRKSRSER
jgi:hypothetical protein